MVVRGVLKAATGPLAFTFHWMGNAPWVGSLDLLVAVALTAVGVSLMLGYSLRPVAPWHWRC